MSEEVVLWSAAGDEDLLAWVTLLCPSPDGAWLLVADEVPMGYRGGVTRLLRLDGSMPPKEFTGRDDVRGTGCAQWSDDGQRLLLGFDGALARWTRVSVPDCSSAWHADAPHLAQVRRRLPAGRVDAIVAEYEQAESFEEMFTDPGPVFGAMDGSGRWIAGGSHPTTDPEFGCEPWLARLVHVWSDESASPVATFEVDGPAWDLAFGPEGRTLAISTRDGTVEQWDVEGRRQLWRAAIPDGERPTLLRCAPDGDVLVGSEDGRLLRWTGATGQLVQTSTTDGPVLDVVIGPRDRLITLGWTDERIVVHTHDTDRQQTWPTPPYFVREGTCALTPSGDRLLIGQSDRIVARTLEPSAVA